VYYKPFVDWIWAGCFVMALGGIAALAGRRRRVADTAAQAEVLAGSAA
jgi:cytochrome c-type biogenesis protein CcmF